jgi:dienelactone hydrolase
MDEPIRLVRRRLLVLLALCGVAGARAEGESKPCGMVLLPGTAAHMAPFGRKLQGLCTVRTARAREDVARLVKELRQHGARRVVLAGEGSGANGAIDYAGSPGDIDGVIALGGDGAAGDLPQLAPRIKQHIPLLWVVGSGDALAAQGEAYAFAKAPPHPSSRYVQVKADAAGTPEAGAKAVLEWLKSLE